MKKIYHPIDPQVSDQMFNTATATVMTPMYLHCAPKILAHGASIARFGAAIAGGGSIPTVSALGWAALSSSPWVLLPLAIHLGAYYIYDKWNEKAPRSAVALH